MMKKLFFLAMALCAVFSACKKSQPLTAAADGSLSASVKKTKNAVVDTRAPLYWNPYEYNIVHDDYIPESEWLANINWVDNNLKAYGYKMICI
ncbi:MAG: hypothetical protein EOP46_07440, partial [Sphingobacteriaceae bacterium]